jgi:bifunctional non-homologous end joining protein LigD
MSIASTTLSYTEGSSDKVYAALIKQEGDGFIVAFQYGRRGSSLTAGTKTPTPVTLEQAQRIYEKLLNEKRAKGYTESDSGERYQGTENAGRVSGVLPQLLNPVDESEVDAILLSDSWVAQQKFDGERRLIIIDGDTITGTNRNGLTVPISERLEQAIRATIAAAIPMHTGRTVLDGEDLGDAGYAVFDLLELQGACVRQRAYYHRLASLDHLLARADRFIISAQTMRTEGGKRDLLKRLRAANAEGIVFKDVAAPWSAGRPASGGPALKLKFVATATVAVGPSREGKRSVEMRVRGGDGALVPVGNCTIPANADIPPQGAHIEVRYLYRSGPNGALFQPSFLRLRGDKSEPDTIDSLKLKAA